MSEGLETTSAPRHPLAALHEQLSLLRREALMAVRTKHLRALPAFVATADLEWLNRELVGVQALNAEAPHHARLRGVAAWASPPLRADVLHAASDLLPFLSDALVVLAYALDRRAVRLADA